MKNVHLIPTDKPSRLLKTTPKGNLILSKSITSGSHWENQNIYITSSDEEIKEGDWFICGSEILKCIKAYSLTSTSYVKCKKGDCSVEICKKIILTTDEQLIKDGIQPIDDEFLEWFVKNPTCEWVELYQDKEDYGSFQWYSEYKIIIPSEELNPCKDIVINDKATIDVLFHNKHIRFENLTSEQANYLVQVSEFYQLNSTRRSAVVPQEEPKQETLEEASERYEKIRLAHNENYIDSNDIQDLKESYYYKGRRDECIKWQQERSYSGEEPDYKKIKQALVEMRKVPMTFVPDERMYSEEEVITILESLVEHPTKPGYKRRDILKVIEQFKKK